MASQSSSLKFTVQRCQPELVAPAKPTPHEVKPLSDIDDQYGLRLQIPILLFYHHQPSMIGKDPVQIIRKALAETLVFYYPFAGRLRERLDRKLMVDCTGEGVLFIEADADVRLDQFRDASFKPPFPCFEEIFYDVPGSGGVINCPLLLFQVTRLKCGGFILGIRLNHTMSDGTGFFQFMNALAEIARGKSQPSVPPVWQREILCARNPPHVTYKHYEYEQPPNIDMSGKDNMIQQSFFFGPTEIAALRILTPYHLRECSTFELLTACLWRCRTLALLLKPEEEVRMMIIVDARAKLNPPLPVGYYGNAFVFPAAISTARMLVENSLGYALELVIKAKSEVTGEYVHSAADLLGTTRRPVFITLRSCIVSDVRRIRAREVDFGWGKAVYGGMAQATDEACFYVASENDKGEEGTLLLVCLPAQSMDKFAKALNDLLARNVAPTSNDADQNSSCIMSSM